MREHQVKGFVGDRECVGVGFVGEDMIERLFQPAQVAVAGVGHHQFDDMRLNRQTGLNQFQRAGALGDVVVLEQAVVGDKRAAAKLPPHEVGLLQLPQGGAHRAAGGGIALREGALGRQALVEMIVAVDDGFAHAVEHAGRAALRWWRWRVVGGGGGGGGHG